jgi:hypothetical protein
MESYAVFGDMTRVQAASNLELTHPWKNPR